jgi:hypothetical protein
MAVSSLNAQHGAMHAHSHACASGVESAAEMNPASEVNRAVQQESASAPERQQHADAVGSEAWHRYLDTEQVTAEGEADENASRLPSAYVTEVTPQHKRKAAGQMQVCARKLKLSSQQHGPLGSAPNPGGHDQPTLYAPVRGAPDARRQFARQKQHNPLFTLAAQAHQAHMPHNSLPLAAAHNAAAATAAPSERPSASGPGGTGCGACVGGWGEFVGEEGAAEAREDADLGNGFVTSL